MSDKEGGSSDEGNVPLKQAFNDSTVTEKKSSSRKNKKSAKKDSSPAKTPDKSTPAKENEEAEKSDKPRKKSKFYVEVEEEQFNKAVPLLDQPAVIEGSRQRRAVIQPALKTEVLKHGAIPIPPGKGIPLGRIPTITSRFKRLRLDEIKQLHRLFFGKLGNLSNLNNNILKFNGFTFAKDSPEYAKKLVALGKIQMSVLREYLFFLDLDLKIRKKEDATKAILDFLLSPKRAEVTVNPNIVSHPKRKATKRNYYEREIEDDQKRRRKAKTSKAKEGEATEENGDASAASKSTAKEKDKTEDEESKENNSGADNTNELKKPAKKRKRNQVIEEPPENTDDTKSKKNKSKETNDESAINEESDTEVNNTEDLTDDELKNFLKKVLADANLEKTTMKTVYSLISQHYPNYNFSKKKDFIKEVVKSAIQT